ncbi:hypothetical protein [Streptomyces sp. TLI_55]|uniref:hypothetical protein n=1 Tax=Streptomyces sp. TLI_55 TaxID=1938861 RepID=UPI0015CF17D2|nr:hypothetical protein [Streptomyces sp. TLI_55]
MHGAHQQPGGRLHPREGARGGEDDQGVGVERGLQLLGDRQFVLRVAAGEEVA